jgi:hypothetical protein
VDEGGRTCTGCARVLELEAFPLRGSRCLECRRAAGRRHYEENRAYYVDKARRRNAQVVGDVRIWLDAYLVSHPCVDCGIDDPRVLEFDHRDGVAKTAAVAQLARWGYALRRVQEEVAKCDVRCANCHRVRTHRQRGWWGAGDGPFENR